MTENLTDHEETQNYDYAIHSDFLIHWTGKDIDKEYDPKWYEPHRSDTKHKKEVNDLYIKRIKDILEYGLWMTIEEKSKEILNFKSGRVPIPDNPQTCFTELKLSESRKHAKQYGRLGMGVKRRFIFDRFGRPLIYYGFHTLVNNDKFLETCATSLKNGDEKLLNFFKPMNSSQTLNYDFYSESEWRIIFFDKLLSEKLIIDPRNPQNTKEYEYLNSIFPPKKQDRLQYLIPLDGWFAMIIYPSLAIKNIAQQDKDIRRLITNIKEKNDHGNRVEGKSWPIEVDLDACRNF